MGTFVAGCSRKPVSAMFLAFALTKDLLAFNPILVACLANRADCGCASVVHRSERATTPPLRPLRPLLELGARRTGPAGPVGTAANSALVLPERRAGPTGRRWWGPSSPPIQNPSPPSSTPFCLGMATSCCLSLSMRF